MTSNNNTILLFNIERGVLSSTINISSANNNNKKKKRKSSLSQGNSNEILVDVIASSGDNNSLFALVYFPTNDTDSSSSNNVGGKCRLYQYTLTDNEEPTLIKKIKVGSISGEGGGKLVFGLGISKSNIVVRLNNQVRVVDLGSGDKLCKLELPSDGVINNGEESEEAGTSFVPLAVTNDGRYIVTSSSGGGGNQAVVLSYANQDAKHSLKSLAMLSTKDDEESISNFDITQLDNNDENLAIVAFQSKIGTSSLFNIPTTSNNDDDNTDSSTPTLPKATLQTNELDKHLSLIGCKFNSTSRTTLSSTSKSLTLLFNQGKKHVGAGSAGTGTNLPMESLTVNDSKLEGNVLVGVSLSTVDEKGNKKKDDKKRKVHENVALAPGDQGLEASTAMDLSQAVKKKKARVSSSAGEEEGEEAAAGEDEDDFDLGDEDDEDDDGENGQSIAERLALLSSAMEQSDDDTDSEDDEAQDSSSTKQVKPFKLKSATSETLTTLLTQALTSNDSSQLNIALQVTDRRLVEGTVRALQAVDAERRASQSATETLANHPGYVSMLMAHIVRRMARRHTLVNVLGVWVKAILAATARSTSYQGGGSSVEEQIMANEGREMALKLGPLKNFLNERVECFPQLLRLEGRLSLLNQQF